jgi:serine/threonine protein kinase
MSMQRSQPPRLDGYTFKEWLGGGGFADVFLYEQLRPSRDVAVKVLRLTELDPEVRRAFDGEANLMAKVSAHPFIVTVFGADTAGDGRPYLVMEYYARPHYGIRASQGGISVADVLRLGVQVGSAVEVAHRAGILHRDIKPANILVNEYDRPGLTDFGIAGARAEGGEQAASGWSVPYAPPEILSGRSPGDEVSDVYSLAATLYTILAGRSPFASTTGRSTGPEMQARVLNQPAPPIRRDDVPRSLELLLLQALAKDPAERPRSAFSFARSLQGIQRELRYEQLTQLEVPEVVVSRPSSRVEDDERTRAGRLQVVRPEATSELVTGAPKVAVPLAAATPFQGPVPELAPVSQTIKRSPAAEPVRPTPEVEAPEPVAVPPRFPVPRGMALAAAAIVALVAVAALLVGLGVFGNGGGSGAPGSSTATDDGDVGVLSDRPGIPTAVTVRVASGGADVTWTIAGAKPGDKYRISRAGDPNAAVLAESSTSPAHVQGVTGGCVQVVAVRGSYVSDAAIGCAS